MDGRIFISHSTIDRNLARSIYTTLEDRGFLCWVAPRDVGPGDNYQEAIVRAIRDAEAIIVVLTSNANKSSEMKKEVALASRFRIPVIPIRLEDCGLSDAFEFELATRQYIDFFVDWEAAVIRLCGKLKGVSSHASPSEGLRASSFVAQEAAPGAPAQFALRGAELAVERTEVVTIEARVERRLAAILAADVVGYSRLMEANEERTLGALRQHRRELFDPAVSRHGGRIFKVMGDGFLVEFGSVVSAARCAVEIQRGMLERNAGIPEDRHFKFRMGINIGDIIVDGNDFHGDGVNLAVRLQDLATPGGIACSAAVRREVHNKLDTDFVDQGMKTVKNIAEPVHVYFAKWANIDPRGEVRTSAGGETLIRPGKPSVAILPFANMSNDPEQEFFSDGVTEDIITDLSNVSGLFVLNRNAIFAYKRRTQAVEHIAKELGVAYLVEGAVRKAGNRVRINAKLIDGASDGHLWAARYDRDLTDIFAVQDEIAKAIVEQLKVKLLPEEKRAIEQASTTNVEAYTHYLRGREYYHIASKANHLMARQSFARAIELDPRYARAYAGIAICDVRLQSSYGAAIPVDEILAMADRALAIDPRLAEAQAARAFALALGDRRAEAAAAFEQALALDPDCHEANRYYAEFCVTEGRFELAATHFLRAMEIKPTDYGSPIMLVNVFRSLGQKDKTLSYARLSVKKAEEELRRHPENANCACLGAVVLAFLGEHDQATQWLARSLATDPDDKNIQYNAACTYSQLGEADRAIDLLEIWLPEVGAEMRLWFENDSDLDPIRSHPRYQKLVELSDRRDAGAPL